MPEEAMSFTERKRAELSAERDTREAGTRQVDDPSQRAPIEPAESADEQEDVSSESLLADDEDLEIEEVEASDSEDGAPEGEETDEAEEDTTDWKKRYDDLELKFRETTENRTQIEKDLADQEAETLKVRFELEDRLEEVGQRAAFWLQTMTGNAQQYRNINWGAVAPDQIQKLQAEAQQALMLEQQAQQAYDATAKQISEQKETLKQREAEVAKMRLRRTIPDWGNEKYNALRDYASQRGLDPQIFSDITSAPLIEMINDSMSMRTAGESVEKTVSRRKAKPGKRHVKRQPRDARGKFQKAQQDFQNNPGQRGRFSEMKLQQLQMERKGR